MIIILIARHKYKTSQTIYTKITYYINFLIFWSKIISTESFLAFSKLQLLVSYKQVSFLKYTRRLQRKTI